MFPQKQRRPPAIMTASLSDADLAKAEVDLPSWLLQDDAAGLQDFCFGAKDMHSTSPCDPGYASPPFIPFQDLPDWMESKDDFCINGFQKNVNSPVQGNENFLDSAVLEDFSDNPNDLIKKEMEQQQKLEFLQFGDELDELPIIEHDLHGAGLPAQQQQQPSLLAPSVQIPILFDASDDFSEILPSQLPVSTDSSSFVECQQPEMTQSKPVIISVSLSEAVNYKAEEQQVFSVPTTATEMYSGTASVGSGCSNNNIMMMNVAPTTAGHKQQPLVINLKKVRVTPKPAPVTPPQPTLKEVLTSDEADSFIKELITLPCYSPEHATEEESESHHTIEASIEDFSSDEDESSQASDSASESSYDPSSEHSSSSVRYAPYSSMERKLRKKEQNKRAALRYRQKKKNEEESIMGTMRAEQEKQKELVEKCNALQMEVKMMKRLMKDMLIAKGKL